VFKHIHPLAVSCKNLFVLKRRKVSEAKQMLFVLCRSSRSFKGLFRFAGFAFGFPWHRLLSFKVLLLTSKIALNASVSRAC
jgi:hypothetical protein